MPMPVLGTKLFVPQPRPHSVRRPHLITRMREGLQRKLTLISAAAGFGKTTLAAEMGAACGRPVAWLSLDNGDSELPRFLTHVVSALQTVTPGIGEDVLAELDFPRLPPIESLLTPLVNDLAAVPDPLMLVLDDYHSIEGQAVDDALGFLVEHLPPQVHLCIATRQDPPLPLARLRASGQLTEVRAGDLRFTTGESARFLNDCMRLGLTDGQVRGLETRTEGWIAGLQMAALSLNGRADADSFVEDFTGSHRFVLDYLVDEVLSHQSERVRCFLLHTSILDRLCGPLCDALIDEPAGTAQDLLEALDHSNLLIVPLDEKRLWYRYHHLFADVLRSMLRSERPQLVRDLHNRASEWFWRNSLPAHAVEHAFAAGDDGRAADLIEATWLEMDRGYESGTWLSWAKGLPDELIRERPYLAAGYAWASLDAGDMEAAQDRLADVERWLDLQEASESERSPVTPGHVTVDDVEFARLPIMIANGRAYHAASVGDAPRAVRSARLAIDRAPESQQFERGLGHLLLGSAQWSLGELESARENVTLAVSHMWSASNTPFAMSFTSYLADIAVAQGRLGEAMTICHQGLRRAHEQGKQGQDKPSVLHLVLYEIHHERGEDTAAARHLSESTKRGEQLSFPSWYRHWSYARARQATVSGDVAGALEELAQGERLYFRHPVPNVRPLSAARARLLIWHGLLGEARSWASERGLSATDEVAYLHEYEHLTLVRLLIAEARRDRSSSDSDQASSMLARLLKAAEADGRTGSIVEILALQALADELRGKVDSALIALARSITLAEAEGWLRVFVDEGRPMARLLSLAIEQGSAPGYANRLLAAVRARRPVLQRGVAARVPGDDPSVLADPLTELELETLRLISQGLSNREIGARLHRALDTIKGQNRRIFSKLGVRNRTEAVARAQEVGLLDT